LAQAKHGDTVKVHYTGRLEDGTVFDTSRDGRPLRFTIGDGKVIAGFEAAVQGMEPGQSRTTTLEPEAAYGERIEELVLEIDRAQVPDGLDPAVGQQLQVRQEDGEAVPVMVAEVTEETITLDANHPLAGKSLVFDIELVEIG
jgi:peptidylprolyl isomerase